MTLRLTHLATPPVLAWILVFGLISVVWSNPIGNLKSPQSTAVDPGKGYFIANANGDPGNRDNHGFITKLNQEGEVVDLHFIHDGQGPTVLHSPTGMVLVDQHLFVADLDTIRVFDKTSGEPVFSISLTRHHCSSLAGLTATSDGRLYVSDTDTNAIYQIDPAQDYEVSLFVQDDRLSGPRGLAINPRSGQLVGVSWNGGKIFEINGKGKITELMANTFFSRRFYNLDGIDFDRFGSMYVSDFTAGKIWRIRPDFKKEVIAEFLISPAGLAVDREKHLILVPYLYANGAEINGLEMPVNAGKKRKRRTLSDYGLKFPDQDAKD
jgi:DNA-binding beta-propeller fold protein YncE